MTAIINLLLKAVLGGLVDAFNAWRRDQDLQKLGYTTAQRDQAVQSLTAANAVVAAQQRSEAVAPVDRAAAIARLRAGGF